MANVHPNDPPPITDDKWLTTTEAAEYLGLSVRALYSAVQRGQIPVHRLGRRLRFLRSEVDAVIRGRR